MNRLRVFFAMSLLAFSTTTVVAQDDDPYRWLEDVTGARALEWVRSRTAATVRELENSPEFARINRRLLDILNSKDRLAEPSIVGEYIYNFWQDDAHPRGIWRRVPFDGYATEAPPWETVLDLDALSAREGKQWAFSDVDFLHPAYDRCLLHLSRGGGDAVEVREFDLLRKEFVSDGFFLPEGKIRTCWIDRNTIVVGSNQWDGEVTTSGYPRTARLWRRGTAVADAPVIFEGSREDVGASVGVIETADRRYIYGSRATSFFSSEISLRDGEEFVRLDFPVDAQFHGFFKNQLIVELRSAWMTGSRAYPQGALIAIDIDRFRDGARDFSILSAPDPRSSIVSLHMTRNALLLVRMTDVRCELQRGHFVDGRWDFVRVPLADNVMVDITDTDPYTDRYFFTLENFLQPRTLYSVLSHSAAPVEVRRLPAFFDSEGCTITQHHAVAPDGERIPYFLVAREGLVRDGGNPTMIEAYGGFEVPMVPYYEATVGAAWIEHGGVYVLANIRGGGEFGPRWHQAALKEKRQTAFNDLYAVAEDLIRLGVTSPRRLGILGGSNGGLLAGVAFTQRPDLFNAVVCLVPLLDMRRYSTLLAGASWIAEYGDPDIPEEWAYIKKYSPYHNLSPEKTYPRVLFATTTHDDRVHPAHARKMSAKMLDMGHDCLYFENTEGGHGAGVTAEQQALFQSIAMTYLHLMLR